MPGVQDLLRRRRADVLHLAHYHHPTDERVAAWYDAVAIWQRYSDAEVTGGSLPTNHYIPEEDPAGTLREMLAFFGPA